MKKLFLCLLALFSLNSCGTYYDGQHVQYLSVEFLQPTKWNGNILPPSQSCRAFGGVGSTPPLYISKIPAGTNLLILEMNNLDVLELAQNGGLGSIGFYHDGSASATLLPVPGETFELPNFAFEEKGSRVNSAKPYPYQPPCIEKKQRFSATLKAVKRTGSFDRQETVVLGIGEIYLGTY